MRMRTASSWHSLGGEHLWNSVGSRRATAAAPRGSATRPARSSDRALSRSAARTSLMASTYPFEVVQADRFAKANKALKGDKLTQALDKQDWDASVKQLVSTPTVLAMMSDQLDWTEKLGDAVLAQQADLMDAIQRLRGQAQANGKLETTKQQKVTVNQEANKQVIEIEPASPEVVYVPYYNPSVVYGAWPTPTIRLITILPRGLRRRWRDRDRTCVGSCLRYRSRDLGQFRLGPRQHQRQYRQECEPQRRSKLPEMGAQFLSPARREL